MKNKNKVIIALVILLISLFLPGYTTTSKDILNLFKNITVESVKSFQINKSGPFFSVSKSFQYNDLIKGIKILNGIKGVKEELFPNPKGFFHTWFSIHMQSGEDISFLGVNGAYRIRYDDGSYKLIIPGLEDFFVSMINKYSVECAPKYIDKLFNYKKYGITKIALFNNASEFEEPITIADKSQIDKFIGYFDHYVITKEIMDFEPSTSAYRAVFYSNNKKLMDISFTMPILINGNYYRVYSSGLNDNIIDEFLKSLDTN